MSRITMPRRSALLVGMAGLGGSLVGGSRLAFGQGSAPAIIAADSGRPRADWGAAAGDVLADRALIWSRADRTSRMLVEWATDEGFRDARRVLGPYATEASDYTARLDLRDLPPDADIFYRVSFQGLDADRAASLPVSGRFRTAPVSRRDVRFLFSGDTNGQGWGIDTSRGGFATYESMRQTNADFFVHLGDTIYADSIVQPEVKLADGTLWRNLVIPEVTKPAESLAEFRGRHRYNLLDRNVRNFHSEIAQVWMWDDHEVTNNYSDSKVLPGAYHERSIQRLKAYATQAFWDYAPIRPHGADDAERIYRTISYGPHLDVFCLDMRSYRGPNSYNRQEGMGPESAFLGQSQLRWLLAGLQASKATWKVIAADMPIGIAVEDGKDAEGRKAYEAIANGNGPALGREMEIAQLLSGIKAAGLKNIVWITADVHYTAAHHYHPDRAQFKDFTPFWEFVSGPLQAGGFGPNTPDDTFGIEVVWQQAPGVVNAMPEDHTQFFGETQIDGRSGVLTMILRNRAGTALWQKSFEPEQPA